MALSATAAELKGADESRRPAPVPMRGIDHLALVTDDIKATMDFYTRVLQMRLVHVRRVPFERDRGQPPYDNLRHYFFDMGNDTLLAFFEYPKGLARANRDVPGGMQHLAFHLPQDSFDALVAHVRSCGIPVIGPVRLGGRFHSAYFYDNNGIRLELATIAVGERAGVVESVRQSAEEARAELTTLFDDGDEVERWLARMPLLGTHG
jgi:catechol 2,3-dioxygenase-like lactoylglutathione lyase family enzyme